MRRRRLQRRRVQHDLSEYVNREVYEQQFSVRPTAAPTPKLHMKDPEECTKAIAAKQKLIHEVMRECRLSGIQYFVLEQICRNNGVDVTVDSMYTLSRLFSNSEYSASQLEYLNWYAKYHLQKRPAGSVCKGEPQLPIHVIEELTYQDYTNPEYRYWISIIDPNSECEDDADNVYTEGCFIRTASGELTFGIRTTTQEAYYQEENEWPKDWVEEYERNEEDEYDID